MPPGGRFTSQIIENDIEKNHHQSGGGGGSKTETILHTIKICETALEILRHGMTVVPSEDEADILDESR